MSTWPFHQGELEAQERAGQASGGAAIRDFMPDQHRDFFGLLHYVFVGALDRQGWPTATVLTGSPGFISSPDPQTLAMEARPDPQDPAAEGFFTGASLGILGLDLGTRRRNRANGVIADMDDGGMRVAVRQSFGNCPQFIQARDVEQVSPGVPVTEAISALDAAARDLIVRADTFFVASASGAHDGPTGGVDISHRGGRPGFVHVDGQTLTVPDFRGNRYFNTLGNLLVEPRAALLFLDFSKGDVLLLQGITEILWDPEEGAPFDGAERLWRFQVVRGWHRRGAVPLRWTFRDYAPTTQRTGTWQNE